MTNLDLQFSEKTSFKEDSRQITTEYEWPNLNRTAVLFFFFAFIVVKKLWFFPCLMLAFVVFFCLPPTSRSSSPIGPTRGTVVIQFTKILLCDDQIQSLKKRCNAFIPDFFGMHDMYLLVIAIYGHSRWFVCIFGRENQMLHRLQLLRAVLVWTQMKLQQKQEVISDFSKNRRNISIQG